MFIPSTKQTTTNSTNTRKINSAIIYSTSTKKRKKTESKKLFTCIKQREINGFLTELPLEISLIVIKLLNIKKIFELKILNKEYNKTIQQLFEIELFKEYLIYWIKRRTLFQTTVVENIFSKVLVISSELTHQKAIHFLCDYCQNYMVHTKNFYKALRIMSALLTSSLCEKITIQENFLKKIIEKIPEWDSRTVIPAESLCTLGWIFYKKNIALNNANEKTIENLLAQFGLHSEKGQVHKAWLHFAYLNKKGSLDQLVSFNMVDNLFYLLFNLIRHWLMPKDSILKVQFKEMLEMIEKNHTNLITQWVSKSIEKALSQVFIEELSIHHYIDVESIAFLGLLKKKYFTKKAQDTLYNGFLKIEKPKSKKRIKQFITNLCRLGLVDNRLNMELH